MKKSKPKHRKRLSPPVIKPQKGKIDKGILELILKYLPQILLALGVLYYGHPIG